MQKRSFIFGLGTGLLIACTIFYFVYGIQKSIWLEEKEALINQENPAVRAPGNSLAQNSELPGESLENTPLNTSGEAQTANIESNNGDDNRNHVETENNNAASENPEETEDDNTSNGLPVKTENDSTGNELPEEIENDNTGNELPEETEGNNTRSENSEGIDGSLTEEPSQMPIGPEEGLSEGEDGAPLVGALHTPTEVVNIPPKEVNIFIPGGSNATTVGDILYNSGIIANPHDFVRYLANISLTKRIKSGSYTMYIGMEFDEIAEMITFK